MKNKIQRCELYKMDFYVIQLESLKCIRQKNLWSFFGKIDDDGFIQYRDYHNKRKCNFRSLYFTKEIRNFYDREKLSQLWNISVVSTSLSECQ
jgi:hypothetical protein